MVGKVLIAFFSTHPGAAVLVSVGSLFISTAFHIARAKLAKSKRLANLAKVADIASDVAIATLKVAADAPPSERLKMALAEARRQVLAQLPDIEKSLEAELDTLIHGTVLLELAPGGVVVNMPSPVPGGM